MHPPDTACLWFSLVHEIRFFLCLYIFGLPAVAQGRKHAWGFLIYVLHVWCAYDQYALLVGSGGAERERGGESEGDEKGGRWTPERRGTPFVFMGRRQKQREGRRRREEEGESTHTPHTQHDGKRSTQARETRRRGWARGRGERHNRLTPPSHAGPHHQPRREQKKQGRKTKTTEATSLLHNFFSLSVCSHTPGTLSFCLSNVCLYMLFP